jgi:cobyrinic acid a,c-diamide synthase
MPYPPADVGDWLARPRAVHQPRNAGCALPERHLDLLSVELPEGPLLGHTFHFSTLTTPLPPLATASAAETVWRLLRG